MHVLGMRTVPNTRLMTRALDARMVEFLERHRLMVKGQVSHQGLCHAFTCPSSTSIHHHHHLHHFHLHQVYLHERFSHAERFGHSDAHKDADADM